MRGARVARRRGRVTPPSGRACFSGQTLKSVRSAAHPRASRWDAGTTKRASPRPSRRSARRRRLGASPSGDGALACRRGAFLRSTDGDAEKPASAKKRDHMTPGHGGCGPALSPMCDTGRAAGACTKVLMHRVIQIRLSTRRACGGAAGGASGNPKNVDSRLVKSHVPRAWSSTPTRAATT